MGRKTLMKIFTTSVGVHGDNDEKKCNVFFKNQWEYKQIIEKSKFILNQWSYTGKMRKAVIESSPTSIF